MARRGGPRKGAGRPAKDKTPPVGDKSFADRVLKLVHGKRPHPDVSDPEKACRCEGCDWWDMYWAKDNDARIRLRIWLYDKRDGKAVQTVNHVHDKPIDLNVSLSLGERMRISMEKAEQRVGKRG
jgi:hypothetical protein